MASLQKAVLFLSWFLFLCEHTLSQSWGDVRLSNGDAPWNGRVEIFDGFSEWGTVCDDDWDNDDAAVVCRQLGYNVTGATALIEAYYGEGSGSIFLDDVDCDGSEIRLTSCSHNFWGSHNCGHYEDAAVDCGGLGFTASPPSIRLVGGSSYDEGRVEIYHNGAWGTVCDDEWDDDDARVVCRQLGYSTSYARAVTGGTYGEGTGSILLDNVECDGWESSLASCSSNGWYRHNCDHYEDAGVRCARYDITTYSPPSWNDVRLVGGSSYDEGRVEIYYNGAWGTVCDDEWGDDDARVVCRQLGYSTRNARAMTGGTYGEGTGSILLDDVECDGWESNLASCSSNGWNSHNCGHSEDAGVRCDGESPRPSPRLIGSMTFMAIALFIVLVIAIVVAVFGVGCSKKPITPQSTSTYRVPLPVINPTTSATSQPPPPANLTPQNENSLPILSPATAPPPMFSASGSGPGVVRTLPPKDIRPAWPTPTYAPEGDPEVQPHSDFPPVDPPDYSIEPTKQ